MIWPMIYNDIVVEADDGDGDLRELVAKPLSEHPATCSIVGHPAAKLFDQNKRDLWFALSCCSCLWCFCFVYRLSTCLYKCLLFCCLISHRNELFNSWRLGCQAIRQKKKIFICVVDIEFQFGTYSISTLQVLNCFHKKMCRKIRYLTCNKLPFQSMGKKAMAHSRLRKFWIWFQNLLLKATQV